MFQKNKTLLIFIAIGFCCALLLALLYQLTGPTIKKNQQTAVNQRMAQLVKNIDYDNQPFEHPIMLESQQYFGTSKKMPLYILRKNNKPVAFIFNAVAPDGYNGDINLAVAINPAGQVTGVSITQHHETPGLGDYFEKNENHWLTQFIGKDFSSIWALRNAGGDFDAWTGATITPGAIVHEIGRVVDYFTIHKQELMREV
jgi:electron transport complex protein RnfG